MPHMRSVSWSLVVTRITGMCLMVGSREIERVAWKPLRFGITTSMRIRSGSSRLAASPPAAPSSAVSASWPSFSTMRRMPVSCAGESSTIRMRAMLLSSPRVATAIVRYPEATANLRRMIFRAPVSQAHDRAPEGAAGQHGFEDLRKLVQRRFPRADRVQVPGFPVRGQMAPDLFTDIARGPGRGYPQQRNAADDPGHDRGVQLRRGGQSCAGDVAVGRGLGQQAGEHRPADIVQAAAETGGLHRPGGGQRV